MSTKIIRMPEDIPQEILDFFEIPTSAIGFCVTVDTGRPIMVSVTKYIEKKESK